MNGRRHAVQRNNRVRLKADLAVLLKRVVGCLDGKMVDGTTRDDIKDEIAEMRVRLHPPSGARAPIVLTGYTKAGKTRMPHEPINWKAEGLFDDNGFSAMRYRKD